MKNHFPAAGLCALTLCASAPAQTDVQLGFNQYGLSSLQFGGQQFAGNGSLRLNSIALQTPQGQTISGDLSNSRQVDSANGRVTQNFSWGNVVANYAASRNKLQVTIAITNSSENTITGLYFEPLDIQLPSATREYDGVIPILGINMGAPTALRLTWNSGTLVLCNDDVTQPLTMGFPWALDRPASTLFPIKINTAKDGMYPDNIPYINRPIAPGASDTYRFSLRFGAATDTTKSLADDVYQAFANTYPATLKWPDRRPIGSLIIGTSATGWATNPRGWLLDPSINVFTPQGVADFQSRLLTWADDAVAILTSMNAQGMVTWDIEGEQYAQSTTYIGDPRLFGTLAPEMAGVADAFFKKFTDAGLRVGVCIRPQQFLVSADGSSATQQALADPTQLMIDKMSWARARWGATLFYVDSNGDPNLPYDLNFFRRVQQALPDVLVIPEHKVAGYYGVTAPYAELRQGFASTPSAVRDIYPGAFSTINTADGGVSARYADLQNAVNNGDIILFRGWFDDGNNALIQSLYASQTVNPPSTSFVAPVSGSTVRGGVTVTAQASGTQGVAGVKLLVDNVQFSAEITSGSYTWNWNTLNVSNGSHTLTAVARNAKGQTGSASVTVQVNNPVAAPAVSITSPGSGATVSGTVSLAASASSTIGMASVAFSLDGAALATVITAPYAINWDSTKVANGTHTLTALAKDTAGTTSKTSVSFTVKNAVPPTITISSPKQGATVTGNFSLTAAAISRIAITSVQFSIDGSVVGTATAPPYTVAWNSAKAKNGPHTLSVVAMDSAGSSSTATVTFTSKNTVAAPTVTITAPASKAVVAGSQPLSANASSPLGIDRVQFAIDGVTIATVTSAPYAVTWNSAGATNASHILTVKALDWNGGSTVVKETFTVRNVVSTPLTLR